MSNVAVPDSHKDLLTGPVVVSLATKMPDGSTQVNPVWCSYDDTGAVWVNSAAGRQKDLNLRSRPEATVLAMDPTNPMRWVEVRGNVDQATEDGADDHIDDLAESYIGQRPYPYRSSGEVRVRYRLRPTRVNTMG